LRDCIIKSFPSMRDISMLDSYNSILLPMLFVTSYLLLFMVVDELPSLQ
jgi:hypothetical protein